jgi:hypothetical protein
VELLSFAAEQRFVLPAHVQALLGVSAEAARTRLRALTVAGYVKREWLYHRRPPHYLLERKGLRAVGSSYARSKINESCYVHDVGVAWMALAARRGVWGEAKEVISERRMRSADASLQREAEPLGGGAGGPAGADAGEPIGVRLGGFGPTGRQRLHYPDMVLVTQADKRIAFELELTRKGRTRLEGIIAGYANERRIDAVVYLVEDRSVGQQVERAAARYGIKELVHIQQVRWAEGAKPTPVQQTIERSADARGARPDGERGRTVNEAGR